ncbi:MAG TPA: DedA family protein [Methylomirabilota bacterium]|jgi:membrane protein DedA with SNARE-associated domain
MEALLGHLDFLRQHLLAVVFVSFLIEAAGIPFPSRIILLVATTITTESRELALLVLACATGAVIGDHVPYVGGMLAGPRLLTFYCRITLGSELCVEKTVTYFKRYGAAALLLSRFSASVRLFASALSGCGHLTYRRFLAYDVLGSLAYAALWVVVGRLIGEQAAEILKNYGGLKLLLVIGPLALGGLLGYRLWRRSRYGPARTDSLNANAACVTGLEIDAKT